MGTKRGFTLLEITVAFAILTIALAGLFGLVLQGMVVTQDHRDGVAAMKAAEEMIERLRAAPNTDLHEVFNSYNADPNDDPGGPATAPGPNFDVPALRPHAADPDSFCGRILFPTLDVGGVVELREDVALPELGGGTVDFDGLGAIDAFNHALDDNVTQLPVAVAIEYTSGNRELRFVYSTVLTKP